MTSPRSLLRFMLPALLAIAALGVVRCSSSKGGSRERAEASGQEAGQSGGKGKPASNNTESEPPKPQSELVVGKPVLSQGNVLRFPLTFTSGPGETAGVIHSQVSVPKGSWKFAKADPPFKSHLKISAKQKNQDGGGKGEAEARQSVLELTISGGGEAIDDGLVGYLQFTVPEAEIAGNESPVARILKTLPVQTKAATDQTSPAPSAPSEEPFEMPAAPPQNPGMGCFFFSH